MELQDQTEGSDTLSPVLRAAAMQTVAADAAEKDLLDALPAARHRKGALIVMGLFLISAAALITVPDAGINSLKRWLMPLSDTERYTFTQLDLSGIDTPHHVPYGESFSLTIPLSEKSNRRPDSARARYGNGEWMEATLTQGSYTFTFPGQRAQDNLHIEADDARHSLPIEPVIRPAMENIRAAVKLPAYLERPDISSDLRAGFLSVLEGSDIQIQTTISRALHSATATVTTLPKEQEETTEETPAGKQTDPSETAERKISLKLDGRKVTTSPITIADNPLLVSMQWQDIFGLKPDSQLKIRLETSQDQMPTTYIQGIERQHIMLAEETIEFEVQAEDDYGLKACGLSWQGEFTKPTGDTPAKGELLLEQGGSTRTTLHKSFAFSPANFEIAPQKLILRSWTEDYKPGRGKIYSEPIVLYILTRNEHAQMLKNEFDRAIGELEDIARKEQNLNDENQRIEREKDIPTEIAGPRFESRLKPAQGNFVSFPSRL